VTDSLYGDPFVYRMLFDGREHDLRWYLDLATQASGEILEIGVGTGRVALPLARAGHSVVGVDRSQAMLQSLAAELDRERVDVRSRLSSICADARSLDLGRRFALVLCPFNGLAHQLEDDDLTSLLAAVHRHLEPGGCLAFDVLAPDPVRLGGSCSSVPWLRHPRTGDVCRYDEELSYEPATERVRIRMTIRFMQVEREPEILTLELRQFFPAALERNLGKAGFEVVQQVDLGDSLGYLCAPVGAASWGRVLRR